MKAVALISLFTLLTACGSETKERSEVNPGSVKTEEPVVLAPQKGSDQSDSSGDTPIQTLPQPTPKQKDPIIVPVPEPTTPSAPTPSPQPAPSAPVVTVPVVTAPIVTVPYYPVVVNTASDPVCYKVDAFTCQIEQFLAGAINDYRMAYGLPPVRVDYQLSYSSRAWSVTQARYGYISHSGFPAERLAVVSTEFVQYARYPYMNDGSTGSLVGENLSEADACCQDPQSIARALFNRSLQVEPAAISNVLNPTITSFGVGVAKRGNRRYYSTQTFSR